MYCLSGMKFSFHLKAKQNFINKYYGDDIEVLSSSTQDLKLDGVKIIQRINNCNLDEMIFIDDNKKLAKTSNTPGKTRLINFFNFSDNFILADLPGYGYAKVSKEAQNRWQKYLEEYLLNRTQIKSLIQLIDARHDIQKNDFQMREWISAYNLPIFTVVTKMDYVPKPKVLSVVKKVEKEFGGEVYPFSAIDNRYNEKILEKLTSK